MTETAREVSAALAREQPELPTRFFYDEVGSRLFDRITRLPEYYLTGAERALLTAWAPTWMRALRPRAVVELGAGSGEKTRILLRAVLEAGERATYVPVDVSAEYLRASAAEIAATEPRLDVLPLAADFTRSFPLPPGLPRPVLHAFLGSTIGNFEPPAAVRLLRAVRERMGAEDRFLLGVDLRKDPARIEAAYNDADGVTAAFNLNILQVVNRRAGTDFDPEGWAHRAFYDRGRHRIEMHLSARRPQTVTVPGEGRYDFSPGDTIRTEISAKHDRKSLQALFASAGLVVERWESDPAGGYALVLGAPA